MNAVWPYCAATCVAWTQKYIDLKSYDKFTAYINFIVFFSKTEQSFFSNTEQSYDQIVFSLVLTSKKAFWYTSKNTKFATGCELTIGS